MQRRGRAIETEERQPNHADFFMDCSDSLWAFCDQPKALLAYSRACLECHVRSDHLLSVAYGGGAVGVCGLFVEFSSSLV